MIGVKQTETIKEWLDEARDEARAEALEEGLEQGLEKGREQGLVLGRLEGRVEGRVEGRLGKARDLLVQQVTLRFGTPRKRTLAALERIRDEARLDDLAVRLLEVETWDELLALR